MSREQIIEQLRAHNVFSDVSNEEIKQAMLERLADGIMAGTEKAPFELPREVTGEAEGGTILG